jgi:hypothetical protein
VKDKSVEIKEEKAQPESSLSKILIKSISL